MAGIITGIGGLKFKPSSETGITASGRSNAGNPPRGLAGFRILAVGYGAVETAIESQLLPGS